MGYVPAAPAVQLAQTPVLWPVDEFRVMGSAGEVAPPMPKVTVPPVVVTGAPLPWVTTAVKVTACPGLAFAGLPVIDVTMSVPQPAKAVRSDMARAATVVIDRRAPTATARRKFIIFLTNWLWRSRYRGCG